MENMVNITYVCKFQSEIVAYFTLSSDSIKLNPEDKNHFEKRGGYPQRIPEHGSRNGINTSYCGMCSQIK